MKQVTSKCPAYNLKAYVMPVSCNVSCLLLKDRLAIAHVQGSCGHNESKMRKCRNNLQLSHEDVPGSLQHLEHDVSLEVGTEVGHLIAQAVAMPQLQPHALHTCHFTPFGAASALLIPNVGQTFWHTSSGVVLMNVLF